MGLPSSHDLLIGIRGCSSVDEYMFQITHKLINIPILICSLIAAIFLLLLLILMPHYRSEHMIHLVFQYIYFY
jgi:hypothetical protein